MTIKISALILVCVVAGCNSAHRTTRVSAQGCEVITVDVERTTKEVNSPTP